MALSCTAHTYAGRALLPRLALEQEAAASSRRLQPYVPESATSSARGCDLKC
jgi:hypothetical protein